ncbi:MAG: site-specific integrase [Desulfatibacillum sp.]|nr:site-specific integrase [Desulfatibacillum sp.]
MATLYKRPNDGLYFANWMENGKVRRKSLGTRDPRIAKARFRDFERELRDGKVKPLEWTPGLNVSLFEFAEEFLSLMEAQVRSSTARLYSDSINKAKSCWGDIPMAHITERHIDKLKADLARQPGRYPGAALSTPTINKHLRHIRRAINKAYGWEYIPKKIRVRLIEEKKSVRFLTVEQLGQLLKTITDPEFFDLVLFSGYTGLRSGEIIRLQWADIDCPEGFIRISSEQKNKDEDRIPINRVMREILERCKGRGGNKVFRFRTQTWVSQLFKIYIIKSGLPYSTRFHDLRHTFASHHAMNGTDMKTIQELMRHRSMASTQIYAKLSPERLKEASESLSYGPLPDPPEKK